VLVLPARHLLRARDLIDARYREPLDVPTLARAAHASPAHFAREFRRAFGETPHQYLMTRRLERAASLLRSTDHSVAEICMEVGLSSVGSFTSSFKRSYQLTPTEYRRVSARRPTGADPDLLRDGGCAPRRIEGARADAASHPGEQFWRRQPHRPWLA
jgi:AraC-like DNA-binding protein